MINADFLGAGLTAISYLPNIASLLIRPYPPIIRSFRVKGFTGFGQTDTMLIA